MNKIHLFKRGSQKYGTEVWCTEEDPELMNSWLVSDTTCRKCLEIYDNMARGVQSGLTVKPYVREAKRKHKKWDARSKAEDKRRGYVWKTDKKLSYSDAKIIKFHTELLQCITELYAIPPERLRKVVQENALKDTEASKLTGARKTHTLYTALNESLKYIHDKYFNED